MVKKKQEMLINCATSYCLSFDVTGPMDQSHALQPNNISTCPEFPDILRNHEHLYSHHVHKSAPELAVSSHPTSLKSTVIYRVFFEIGGHILDSYFMDENKEKIS
jgi:hypothetical protein